MKMFAELFKISLHDNIIVYLLGNKKKKRKNKTISFSPQKLTK